MLKAQHCAIEATTKLMFTALYSVLDSQDNGSHCQKKKHWSSNSKQCLDCLLASSNEKRTVTCSGDWIPLRASDRTAAPCQVRRKKDKCIMGWVWSYSTPMSHVHEASHHLSICKREKLRQQPNRQLIQTEEKLWTSFSKRKYFFWDRNCLFTSFNNRVSE